MGSTSQDDSSIGGGSKRGGLWDAVRLLKREAVEG
jgi:hypothetical protein